MVFFTNINDVIFPFHRVLFSDTGPFSKVVKSTHALYLEFSLQSIIRRQHLIQESLEKPYGFISLGVEGSQQIHIMSSSKIIKKTLEEAKDIPHAEIDFSDKNLIHLEADLSRIWTMKNITRLTLSHNKIVEVPATMANLDNLEILNLFNNDLEEIPTSISKLSKLRILNLAMNKLNSLPRGFGSFPNLEVLDLSYNNLNEGVLPGNFFIMNSLRALYLSDNDFEYMPPELGKLVPFLDFLSSRAIIKLDNNPWVQPIEESLQLGISHVVEYLRSETYRYLYKRHVQAGIPPPEKQENKKKASLSRKKLTCLTQWLRLKSSQVIQINKYSYFLL
ncbi:Ras suppressor protein 1 [Lepeophtheirus salmonis]|uniref:Ras suppressor protein 1 n=1 Tax=Lepeophtheirus salmonis TaxID=72036 RepID=A0A7R8GZV1_LEPSM|nr:Ras suppressor protein 1 [Lepeophtheirus salmonis]CAF2758010.1 Ras suppressor protein 1 [Lepeophtheirus salmonis]